MKKENLEKKESGEIIKMISDKKEELRKARFNVASGKLKNTKSIQKTKKDIARLFTSLNKKNK